MGVRCQGNREPPADSATTPLSQRHSWLGSPLTIASAARQHCIHTHTRCRPTRNWAAVDSQTGRWHGRSEEGWRVGRRKEEEGGREGGEGGEGGEGRDGGGRE